MLTYIGHHVCMIGQVMSSPNVEACIRAILADVLLIEDPASIRLDSHIVKDLGAESINVAEITVAIENEFDLIIEDERIREVVTVGALVDFVSAAVASRAGAVALAS